MINRDELLVKRLVAETVEVPGVGTVKVRGLSRGEVFDLRAKNLNVEELEVQTIALCMVEPMLSTDDVRTWMYNAPTNEIDAVFGKIRELSGLSEGAQKSDGTGSDDR